MQNTATVVPSQTPDELKKELTELKDQIMPGSHDAALSLFAKFCAKTKLDPFSRQIYAINRAGKWTYQTSIDGFRVVAERSGLYEGQTPVYWCGQDGKWVDVWLKPTPPAAAKIGVYKKGHREATWAVALFDSYAQSYKGKLGGLWAKMPELMIAKCAEALALRKAFPNDLSGLYTSDEMNQIDNKNQPELEAKQEQNNTSDQFYITQEEILELHELVTKAGLAGDTIRKCLNKLKIETLKDISKNDYLSLKTWLEQKISSLKQVEPELEQKVDQQKQPSFKLD